MRKISITMIMAFCIGCAPGFIHPQLIDNRYTLDDIKTYTVKVHCDKAEIDPALGRAFVENYCQMLQGAIKSELAKLRPALEQKTTDGEISVDVILEKLDGGSAATRFWINFILPVNVLFRAGQTVSAVYVRVSKGDAVIAQRRMSETTAVRHIAIDGTNERALIYDNFLLAQNIAEFVNNPLIYRK